MNYQKLVCWGDSQTFGARTYGCYPLYLSKILNERTKYKWQTINFSTNGHTARDLWFRIAADLHRVDDCFQTCVLIGANDVGNGSPLELFEEYYRQIVNALHIKGFKVIYCGEVPPIQPDGHAFFAKGTGNSRDEYNARIEKVVAGSSISTLVRFPNLVLDSYVDPVHFNEKGNQLVAECFANAIMSH